MSLRTLAVVLTATALAAGCGAEPGDPAAPPAAASGSAEATAAGPVPEAQNLFTVKSIGELGGIGCDETDTRACDLEFAVTVIEPGIQCAGVAAASGTQLVRFTVAATTREVLTYPERLIGGILEARNWGVVGGDGVFDDQPVFADCAETDWGLAGLGPGRQAQGTAVLVAPIGARALRLDAAQAGAVGWEWQIPSR